MINFEMIKIFCLLLIGLESVSSQAGCGADPCASTTCDYGRIFDASGCKTCFCNLSPCQDVVCGQNEMCKVEKTSDGIFIPKCTKSQEAVGCQRELNCSQFNCRYGYKNDVNGCPSCVCLDPCENFVCPDNHMCIVVNVVCPPQGCIDPPMPFCARIPTTNKNLDPRVTENIPGMDNVPSDTGPPGPPPKPFDPSRVGPPTGPPTGPPYYSIYTGPPTAPPFDPSYTGPPTPAPPSRIEPTGSRVLGKNPVCYLPSEVGVCRASLPRYFFDSATSRCELFYYGGCDGNENNFDTLEICARTCGGIEPVNTPAFKGDPCPVDVICDLNKVCLRRMYEDGKIYTDCVSINTYLQSLSSPPLLGREQFSTTRTTTPTTKTTTRRTYLTCEDLGYCPFGCTMEYNSALGFLEPKCIIETMKPSTLATPSPGSSLSRSETCSLRADRGEPCDRGSPETRWYYDSDSATCLPFAFQPACRPGNANNFDAEEDCRSACVCPPCQIDCPYGGVMDALGCSTCECVEPCRDIACEAGSKCQVYRIKCIKDDANCKPFSKPMCLPDCSPKICPYGFKDGGNNKCLCNDPCDNVRCGYGEICRRRRLSDVGQNYAAECEKYSKTWIMKTYIAKEKFGDIYEKNLQSSFMAAVDYTLPANLKKHGYDNLQDKFDFLNVNFSSTNNGQKSITIDFSVVASSLEDIQYLNKAFTDLKFVCGLLNIDIKVEPQSTNEPNWLDNFYISWPADYKVPIIIAGVLVPGLIALLAVCVYCGCKKYKQHRGFAHRNLMGSVISRESIPYQQDEIKIVDGTSKVAFDEFNA